MNNLLDLYTFILNMQTEIGDGAEVSISAKHGCIHVDVLWPDCWKYTYWLSETHLESVPIKDFERWFIEESNKRYRVATVGEE